MIAALKNLFSKKKKKKLNNSTQRVAIIPATPKPASDEDLSLDSLATAPFWYAEHGSFDNVQFVYPSEDLVVPQITTDIRESLKRYLADICPKPDGSMQIYSKLNDPKASVKEITALVSSDPLLAAQVLKLVNSAAFGIADEVTSVGRAVTLLGFQNVKAVVLNHSIRRGVADVNDELSMRIREHSHMSSAIAFHLSESIAKVQPFTVSTISLLHDMGKILYPKLEEQKRGINFSTKVPHQIVEALVASVFAEVWKLPSTICETLQYIHHPCFYPLDSVPSEYRPMVTTLSMANLLANSMGFGDGDQLLPIKKEYLDEIHEVDSPARWLDEKLATKIENTRGIF
jgi:two-component system cell cycle response regulator